MFKRVDPDAFAVSPPNLPTPAVMEAAATANVVVVPPEAELRLRNLETGDDQRFDASTRVSLPTGRYLATMAGRDGRAFIRREVDVVPKEDLSVNLTDGHKSVPHVAIASQLPEQAGGIDFSESLGGAVIDSDLNLWLALVGGGRLLGSRGDYSKLQKFPLHDFANEPVGLRRSTYWRDSRIQM